MNIVLILVFFIFVSSQAMNILLIFLLYFYNEHCPDFSLLWLYFTMNIVLILIFFIFASSQAAPDPNTNLHLNMQDSPGGLTKKKYGS